MSSNVTDLRKALRQGVKAFNDANGGMPVSVDNLDFAKPTDGAPWLRLIVDEGTPRGRTYGHDEYSGYVQLDVNTALHKGETQADALAAAAQAYFRNGRVLTYAGTDAVVRSCARSRGREVDGWWRVSLTIYWDARIDRPGT